MAERSYVMCHNNFVNSTVVQNNRYKSVICIPKHIEVEIKNDCVFITGKLGKLMHKLHKSIDVKLNNLTNLDIYSKNIYINNKALIGTTRSLINNMIIGVTSGFVKKLQLVGIGYKACINEDNIINLTIGLSHSINYNLPAGITAQCYNNTEISLTGIDKQLIGQIAANLRAMRPPEPFKGKGIRYINEKINIKDTKKR